MDNEIQHGNFGYDQYVLQKWDENLPREEDQSQWNTLVRQYLDLTEKERAPYQEQAEQARALDPDDSSRPSSGKVSRMLSPFQTTRERQLCAEPSCPPPIFRTCYNPELERTCEELVDRYRACLEGGVLDEDELYYFNNAQLYNAGENWEELMMRIAGYIDQKYDGVEMEQSSPSEWSAEEWPLIEADQKNVTVVFVLDEGGIREGLFKVKWLDCHGRGVWDNKIAPEAMGDFIVSWLDVFSLHEFGEGIERGGRMY